MASREPERFPSGPAASLAELGFGRVLHYLQSCAFKKDFPFGRSLHSLKKAQERLHLIQ